MGLVRASGRRLRTLAWREVEQGAVGGAHVEDRRAPFDVVAHSEDRPAGLADRRIDGESVGHGGIELVGEHDRRPIRDLELHRHHGWDPARDQGRCGTPEGIGTARPSAFTGIQDRQTNRPGIGEDGGQFVTRHVARAAALLLEDQHAIRGSLVEATMSDEVEDVVFAPAQEPLEFAERGDLEPGHFDEPVLLERAEALVELRPLEIGVEGRVVGRARHHGEHAERRLDRERTGRSREVEIPDQRCPGGEDEMVVRVGHDQVLPRHFGEVYRIGEPQAQPQSLPILVGGVHAAVPGHPDVSGEDRPGQGPAEVSGGGGLGRLETANAPPRATDTEEEVLELEVAERQRELGPGLTTGRIEDASHIAPIAALLDGDVEIVVRAGHHIPLSTQNPTARKRDWEESVVPRSSGHPATDSRSRATLRSAGWMMK